jgi:hypothetical protein
VPPIAGLGAEIDVRAVYRDSLTCLSYGRRNITLLVSSTLSRNLEEQACFRMGLARAFYFLANGGDLAKQQTQLRLCFSGHNNVSPLPRTASLIFQEQKMSELKRQWVTA